MEFVVCIVTMLSHCVFVCDGAPKTGGQALLQASTADELWHVVHEQAASIVFFDLDETLVMPQTTFIYGLPRSDAYVSGLDSCMQTAFESKLGQKMEEAY